MNFQKIIKKVCIRGNVIYLRDVNKISEKGFYQLDDKLIANGEIIDDWCDWGSLIQREITLRTRHKKINQILNEKGE
jgi:hypothetical protein